MLEVVICTQGNMMPFAHRELDTAVQMVLHMHAHTHTNTNDHGTSLQSLPGAGCNLLSREKIKSDFYVSNGFVKRQQLTLD